MSECCELTASERATVDFSSRLDGRIDGRLMHTTAKIHILLLSIACHAIIFEKKTMQSSTPK